MDATPDVESIVEFIRGTLHQFANNKGFAVGIWAGEQIIGTAGFHTIDWANRKVEIGYWLDREQQGKGLMNSACRALLDHAFGELKLNRVEIRCATGNQASNRVAQRLGFQRVRDTKVRNRSGSFLWHESVRIIDARAGDAKA
jgi:ribosomal-protein-serine acetyltransferase